MRLIRSQPSGRAGQSADPQQKRLGIDPSLLYALRHPVCACFFNQRCLTDEKKHFILYFHKRAIAFGEVNLEHKQGFILLGHCLLVHVNAGGNHGRFASASPPVQRDKLVQAHEREAELTLDVHDGTET